MKEVQKKEAIKQRREAVSQLFTLGYTIKDIDNALGTKSTASDIRALGGVYTLTNGFISPKKLKVRSMSLLHEKESQNDAVSNITVDALRVLLKVNDSIIFAEGMLFASTIYTHGYAGDMAEGYKWCLRAIYSDKFFWDENIEQRRTHAAEIAKELWSETKIRCDQGLDIEYSELVALNIEQMRRDIRGLTDPPVAKQLVDESLESLSETRNKVLRLYFGLDKETMTLQEIADSHNLTRERVRHIKDMAIKDLRNRTRSPIKKLHYLHQEVIQDIINRHLFNIR